MPLYLHTLITVTHFYLAYLNINFIVYRNFRMPRLEWLFRLRNLIISHPLLSTYIWHPVTFRVHFKLLLFVYKSLHNQSPFYIKDLLSLKPAANYALRSSAKSLLFVPKGNCSTLGDRAFAHAAPVIWNSQPLTIRTSSILAIFESDGQEKSTKILISWQELKNQFLSFSCS